MIMKISLKFFHLYQIARLSLYFCVARGKLRRYKIWVFSQYRKLSKTLGYFLNLTIVWELWMDLQSQSSQIDKNPDL